MTALLLTLALAQQPCPTCPPAAVRGYEYRAEPADPGRLYLYFNGVHVGGYDVAGNYYRPWAEGRWGPPCAPPYPPPAPPAALKADAKPPDFGMEWAGTGDRKERFTLGGRDVVAADAIRAMKQLTDDSAHLRVTLIGATDAARRDYKAAIDAAGTGMLVQGFAADDALVRGLGFAPGNPAVYVQDKAGRVLARWGHDNPAPAAVALADELRRLRPDYDPFRDPLPGRLNHFGGTDIVWGALALGAGLLTALVVVALAVALARSGPRGRI